MSQNVCLLICKQLSSDLNVNMSHNELVHLESELNRIKEEIRQLDNEWTTNKNQLLDKIRRSTSTTIQTTLDLVNRMNVLTLVYTRKKTEIECQLLDNREKYFTKLQN